MSGLPSPPIKGISVLFLKVADVTSPDNKYENGLDIIHAIEKVSGRGSIEGAQRMGNLFRIYTKGESIKNKLSVEGFTFQNHQVSLYSLNPFSIKEQSPETVKIIIGGVPLSVAHAEFERALVELKVEMVSDIKFENYRDGEGKWTNYKTGRRFVYCKKPSLNLKPFTKIGLWNASIYYRGQIRPSKQPHPTVSTNATERHEDTPNVAGIMNVSGLEKSNPNRVQNAPPEVIETRSSSLGESEGGKAKIKPKGKPCMTSPNPAANAASQNRGRSTNRKKSTDHKQTNLTRMLHRKQSTSIPRLKRGHDTSPQNPPPSKSNTRSKSQSTDWFEETGDSGSDLC